MKRIALVVVLLLAAAFIQFGYINAQNKLVYFTDVTNSLGLEKVSAFRLSVADINGDNYPDIALHRRGETRGLQSIYINRGGKSFIDFTNESGVCANRNPENKGRQSSLAVFGDIDNDGDLDMFSGVYVHRREDFIKKNKGDDHNEIFLNDGKGKFTLNKNAKIYEDGLLNTTCAFFFDHNNDGFLDLFVGNWWKDYDKRQGMSPELYQGDGKGVFANISDKAGIRGLDERSGKVNSREWPLYGASCCDYNNDGYQDLFLATYSPREIVWNNNGDGTFTEVGRKIGVGVKDNTTWEMMPADYDNDGDIDLFIVIVHGYEGTDNLSCPLINQGKDGGYEFQWAPEAVKRDVPDKSHHGDHHATWTDFDNDGLLDLVIVECAYKQPYERLYLCKHNSDHTFTDITKEAGLDDLKQAHPLVIADYDRDGAEDIVTAIFDKNDHMKVYKNIIGTKNNWVDITLEGKGVAGKSNRSAIGARVIVKSGDLTQTREVYAGNGHFGTQHPLNLHFGLGKRDKVDSIEIHWPNKDKTVQVFNKGLKINQFIKITEDNNEVKSIK